jgi:hypothetical protein
MKISAVFYAYREAVKIEVNFLMCYTKLKTYPPFA